MALGVVSGTVRGVETRHWDGLCVASLRPEHLDVAHAFADAAKAGAWSTVLELLTREQSLDANTARPGAEGRYTALHQVAWHGGGTEVAHALLKKGAWRTARTRDGETPFDVATRRDHLHLVDLLTPVIARRVEADVLVALTSQLEALIRTRTAHLDLSQGRYPAVEPLTEEGPDTMSCPVPGMYGGFRIQLQRSFLFVESWSRVVDGSGEAHVVTAEGATLVEQGFV